MPLQGDAKRLYQRDYMRRRYWAKKQGRTAPFSKGLRKPLDPAPLTIPPQNINAMNARRMHEYMLDLNRKGSTLAKTSRGYELVDLSTGEIREALEPYVTA